ncbi:uncharacterized protein N7484_007285 [Penicillium longicatenatum]|uniref:uncharacterized protein n=1 Tax=Penicillium longicatenatum TaxID=1561947 RepID=UPI002546D8D6|nr:uncharacterized protein N7484_007285 [Penicillium longicatenatum]KAJ5639423.1 hypothetical protein N7484_007285 [Penicillium longicatenatum]
MQFYYLVTLGLMSTAYALSPQNNAAHDISTEEMGPFVAPGSGGFRSGRPWGHANPSMTSVASPSSTIPTSTPVGSMFPSEIPVAKEPVAVRAAIRTYYKDYRLWEAATGEEKKRLQAKVQDDLESIRSIKAATERNKASASASPSASASASASATPTPKRR